MIADERNKCRTQRDAAQPHRPRLDLRAPWRLRKQPPAERRQQQAEQQAEQQALGDAQLAWRKQRNAGVSR